MSQFVLVHGAWHGGWCWSRVLRILRQAGHDAHAVTLTGLGERAHLLSAEIRLDTHIEDVVGLIRCEELEGVVLVGHSYAGMVITGVADRLQRQSPGRLRHLVYLDAMTPRPGESWSSRHTPEVRDARLTEAHRSGGIAIPPPDASVFGVGGEDCAWVARHLTPHPFGTYQDPLDFDADRVADLPRTFIDCTSPAFPTIEPMRRQVREEPGWRVVELETGHDAMVIAPEALTALLLDCARG